MKARDKVDKIVKEITKWKGVRPTVVRVNHGDFLALTEVGWIDRFPNVEIKPG